LECKILRLILKAAKVWAPIADDFKPLKEDRRGPGRAIEESQEKRLFETAQSRPGWDAAFYAAMVAANTTMRSCEIKGLRLQDVDLVDRKVTIQKSKTDKGVRSIPLLPPSMWAFARLLERAAALGCTDAEHFLFPACLSKQTKAAGRGTGYDPARRQGSRTRSPGSPPRIARRYRSLEAGRGTVCGPEVP
jgi:integrase